jgi:hypothetical protein
VTHIGFHEKNRHACQILIKLEFSRQIFKKKFQTLNFMKIPSAEAEVFHADRRANG